MTCEPSDTELVAQLAAGNRDAFAALFRRYVDTVYRFSRQMLGSKDAADDITQDVFLALARGAARYDARRSSLATYLYGITRNLVMQRRRRSRSGVEVDVHSVEDDRALVASPDPVEDLARAQQVRELRAAILRLPIHYREVIVLCELNGLSYDEAAAVVGCPIGTIRSRLNRARDMLSKRVVEESSKKDIKVWKPCLTATKNGC